MPLSRFEDSVYGKRDGALTGLALIYNQKGNLFRQTTAWKTGVVHNITMLPRNQMWKPSAVLWSKLLECFSGARVQPCLLSNPSTNLPASKQRL